MKSASFGYFLWRWFIERVVVAVGLARSAFGQRNLTGAATKLKLTKFESLLMEMDMDNHTPSSLGSDFGLDRCGNWFRGWVGKIAAALA